MDKANIVELPLISHVLTIKKLPLPDGVHGCYDKENNIIYVSSTIDEQAQYDSMFFLCKYKRKLGTAKKANNINNK